MSYWLTSALQTVREKSADALEFVRKDLSEFTTTVRKDAETYVNKLTSQPVTDLGIHRLVRRLSNAMTLENAGGQSRIISSTFDRLHNERIRLQNDDSTYLSDPSPLDVYERWRDSNDFNTDERKGEIAQLLIDTPSVRTNYTRLVPLCTSHTDFWSRYYFRLQQAQEEENKRLNLLKRAHEICNETHTNDWDEIEDQCSEHKTTCTSHCASMTSADSKTIICDGESSASVSGDSWEREFDVSDLLTSKSSAIGSDQLRAELQAENLPGGTTVIKQTDNEFDDGEWESWS